MNSDVGAVLLFVVAVLAWIAAVVVTFLRGRHVQCRDGFKRNQIVWFVVSVFLPFILLPMFLADFLLERGYDPLDETWP